MARTDTDQANTLLLNQLHVERGARMVPFAGYSMPVQYAPGVIKEHLHTREQAGLFDVSHMGQVSVRGPGAARQLEKLCPADLQQLPLNKQTYSVFTNAAGGVLDDLIITRRGDDDFFLVVNAACKQADLRHLRANLAGLEITPLERALLAIQGPLARELVGALCPEASKLVFMTGTPAHIAGAECYVTCSGYTGEDGFELSVPADQADTVARALLADERLWPIGLGARDSLRLEAGLCLYGHDLDISTTPVEAGLAWAIAKPRRAGGGFPGADIILQQLEQGPPRRRVGLKVNARVPVREGAEIHAPGDIPVGRVTSGGFSPCLQAPVAMAYLASDYAGLGTSLQAIVRGKPVPVEVCRLPFVPQRYFRG